MEKLRRGVGPYHFLGPPTILKGIEPYYSIIGGRPYGGPFSFSH